MKRSGIRRGSGLQRSGSLPRVSAKRKRENVIRAKVVEAMRVDHDGRCEVCSPVCWGTADHAHELKKRSHGGSIVDPSNMILCCNQCNDYIEDHPLWAIEQGWSIP